ARKTETTLFGKEHADGSVIRVMVAFAHQVANLRAILGVEKGGGQGTVPPGHNRIDKAGFVSLGLAVVRKHGFIAREESAHEDKVPILVQVDAHDLQSLRGILL